MTKNQNTDSALVEWKSRVLALIARQGDKVLDAEAMSVPPAPIEGPAWARVQEFGEMGADWIDVRFRHDNIRWGIATGSVDQGYFVPLVEGPVSGDGPDDREPYVVVRTPRDGDLGAPLSIAKEIAGCLILAICSAEERTIHDFSILMEYIEPSSPSEPLAVSEDSAGRATNG